MADTQAMASGQTWKVAGQTPGLEQGPGGQFVKGVNVHFETASGLYGTVFVADAVYNSPNAVVAIQSQIAAKAAQLETIAKLSG